MFGDLQAAGIGLIGVSYDTIAVLRSFSDANGIRYPLLSDVGSRVITELGLLDRDLDAHHSAFGMPTADNQRGVAYPAVFVVGADGTVEQRRIQANYRSREGGPMLLEEAVSLETAGAGVEARVSQPRVRARLRADGPGYARWQRSRLHVDLETDVGWHLYGQPVPPGYTGLHVSVEPLADVEAGEPVYPAPRPFRVAGLDEDFAVHEGRVSVLVPIAFNVGRDFGPITVRVQVDYQACNDSSCLPPSTIPLEIVLTENPVR